MESKTVPIVIEPQKGIVSLRLRELWEYRELVYFLTWRDLKVRYKQTIFGVAWAVLQPVLTMVVFTIFFGKAGKIPSNGFPYPVFAYTALLPWQLFAHAVSESGNSLVASQNLITKVYFPRLVIPLAPVFAGLVDFLVAFPVLILLMLYYGIAPRISMLMLPLFLILALVSSVGVGLWLSALNVKYRDVRYTIPFLTQIWLFVTPVIYPSSTISVKWRTLYGLNPMTGVVEGFRWAILGSNEFPGKLMIVSTGAVLVLLVGGLFYFRKMETVFAVIA